MNNKTLPTTHLGRELPKDYINSIEKGESFPEWLTMFPHTEYEHSTEIEVWNKEDLLSHTYSESFCNYAFFTRDDLDFSRLETREEDSLTPEELHLVRMGKKINAIKIYRDRTGVSLADAKAAIDAVG